MPAAWAVTLQEQEVLRKEPILFFLVYYLIVSGAEDFKMLLPNAPGPWSLVPSTKWKNPQGCHWWLPNFWNGPKLNPSLRIQLLFLNAQFLSLKTIFLSKPLDFCNICVFSLQKNSLSERNKMKN
jgi:hypothetical protein